MANAYAPGQLIIIGFEGLGEILQLNDGAVAKRRALKNQGVGGRHEGVVRRPIEGDERIDGAVRHSIDLGVEDENLLWGNGVQTCLPTGS